MKYLLQLLALCCILSCNKQDEWLNVKSNKADVTPVTLADYQALLDNDGIMNTNYPGLGLVGSDNYFLTTALWQSASPVLRNAYIWAPDIYEGSSSAEWSVSYRVVEYTNVILDGLSKINPGDNVTAYNNAKGSALFFRSMAFYNVAALFAAPFDSASANVALGIPLRMSADVNIRSVRASVAETYQQIISDLSEAIQLLPETPVYKTRPSKPAVYGLLARVYLQVGDYPKAFEAANNCLAMFNYVYNFNSLNPALLRPFPVFENNNAEVIFYATTGGYSFFTGNGPIVDTTLYSAYTANDLRKTILYRSVNGIVYFKGSYTGIAALRLFAGIATNEVLLTRAEASARMGNTAMAMADLNTLMITRWKANTFIPLTASSPQNALQLVINERRKELPFTSNIRWEDLRRLNKEPAFATTIKRVVNNQSYQLLPGDKKYTYPIPELEIQLSGMQQNPR